MPKIKSSDLVLNQGVSSDASDSSLEITIDSSRPLKVGRHTFRLVVADDSGNVSKPATLRVVVLDDIAPTAIIDGPDRVSVGKGFTLSGARSVDVGGAIASYTWTLVEAP